MMSDNNKIQKVVIEGGNSIRYKYIDEINEACARNRQLKRDKAIPKCLEELGKIVKST